MQPVCQHCGQSIAANQTFCGSCGSQLGLEGLDEPTIHIDESHPRWSLVDGVLQPIGAPDISYTTVLDYPDHSGTQTVPSDTYTTLWTDTAERQAVAPPVSERKESPLPVTPPPVYPTILPGRTVPDSARSQDRERGLEIAKADAKNVSRRKALRVFAGLSVLAAGLGGGLVISSQHKAGAKIHAPQAPARPTLKAALTFTYFAHHAPVYGVIWEPMLQPGQDKFRLASCASNAQLWDAFNGGNRRTYRAYQGEVFSLAWCHSTNKIVSGNFDGTAHIWRASTVQHVNTLVGHTAAIRGVAWARDGIHIATASNDMQVGLWPLDTQNNDAATPIFLQNHGNIVYAVSFSNDSKYLVSGSADRTAMLWHVRDGAHLATYAGHKGEVRAVAFAPGSSQSTRLLIATGSEDKTVQVWTWSPLSQTFHLVTQYTGHDAVVNTLSWSPDGRRIASGDSSGQVHIWQSQTAEKLLAFQPHHDSVNALAWSPEGKYLASAGQDQVVHINKIF